MIKMKDILTEQLDKKQMASAAIAAIHQMKGKQDLAQVFDQGKTKYGNVLLYFEFMAEGKPFPEEIQLDQSDKNIISAIGKAFDKSPEYAISMSNHPDARLRTLNAQGKQIVDLYD